MSTLIASAFDMQDRALIIGGKRITVKAQTDDTMTIGGYLVSYGDESKFDTQGQWFTADTYFGPQKGNGQMTVINHCIPIKPALKALTELVLPSMTVTEDELGLWAEIVLDTREKYQGWVASLALKGAWCFSSGSAPHLARVKSSGEITRWPIIEGSLTPQPIEARISSIVLPLKAYMEILDTMETQQTPAAATATTPATTVPATTPAATVQAGAVPAVAAAASATKSNVIGAAIKSLPGFQVLAVKSEYFGDYLEQSMTYEALQALTRALNGKLCDALYSHGGEVDPSDIAEFPAILSEFGDIYMATILALMGAELAEESAETPEDDMPASVGGGLAAKSVLHRAFDFAIKGNMVLSSKNATALKAAIEQHMSGIDHIQGVLDRHEEKSTTATKAVKSRSAELMQLRRENAALKAQQSAAPAEQPVTEPETQPESAIKSVSWSDFAATFNATEN